MRVVFTSGYSDDVVQPVFLAKPYTYAELAEIIRESLHQPEVIKISS